jgi:nitrogen fixation/metabolism regulation signal transduction histidine kinase
MKAIKDAMAARKGMALGYIAAFTVVLITSAYPAVTLGTVITFEQTVVRGAAGVGLAVVRGMVERHGGRAWVESKGGEGSTFWIALPVAEPEVVVRPRQAQQPKKAAG